MDVGWCIEKDLTVEQTHDFQVSGVSVIFFAFFFYFSFFFVLRFISCLATVAVSLAVCCFISDMSDCLFPPEFVPQLWLRPPRYFNIELETDSVPGGST